jgi:hypothetical protein
LEAKNGNYEGKTLDEKGEQSSKEASAKAITQ